MECRVKTPGRNVGEDAHWPAKDVTFCQVQCLTHDLWSYVRHVTCLIYFVFSCAGEFF